MLQNCTKIFGKEEIAVADLIQLEYGMQYWNTYFETVNGTSRQVYLFIIY